MEKYVEKYFAPILGKDKAEAIAKLQEKYFGGNE